MARIRTIKPEFAESESMGRVSRNARLTFILLWTRCDDAGRSRANSRMLASTLFPYDNDAPQSIDSWLDELQREGCVTRYDVDGAAYVQVRNWLKHQKIDKPSASRLPAFDEGSRVVAKPREASTTDLVPRTIVPRTIVPSTEVPGTTLEAHASGDTDSFDEWWNKYPLKKGKTGAQKAYLRVVREKKATPAQLLEGAGHYAVEVVGKESRFIAHATTWLSQGRWDDEPAPNTVTAYAPNGHGRASQQHERLRDAALDMLAEARARDGGAQ